ncbi:diguanylate cyclase [Photobacterium frigidiphilum]|uniref:diguanylate cyclase domain-containing protein n=1 Tax=Photobacterium frigidiphilum TaxID=264736 RepID=UPI003D13F8DA
MKMKLRLKYSLASLMIFIAVIPAVIVGGLLLKQQTEIETNYQREKLERLSSTLRQEFNYRFYVLSTSLDVLSRDRLLVQAMDDFFLTSHVRETLEPLVSKVPLVESAYLIDSDWEEVENYNGITSQSNFNEIMRYLDEQYEKKLLENGYQWLFTYVDKNLVLNEDNPSDDGLIVVDPIYSSVLSDGLQRKPVGYLVVVIPTENISKMLKMYLTGDEKVTFLRNEKEILNIKSDGSLGSNGLLTLNQKIKIDSDLISNPLEYEVKISMDKKPEEDKFTHSLQIISIVGICMVIVGIFGAAITYRWVTRPLAALMVMVRSYSRGDYDQRERKLRFSEFYQVGELFHEMATTIEEQLEDLASKNTELKQANNQKEKYNRQLINFNDKLEKKVEEKTEELTLSLEREERRRDILKSLLAFSSKLQQDDIKSVVLAQVSSLYPEANWALKLSKLDNDQWQSDGIVESALSKVDAVQNKKEYFFIPEIKSLRCFNLIDSSGQLLGCLIMKSETLARTDFEIVSLFARQLSSVIEGRILNAELERIAVTDALTELPNRKAFDNDFNNHTERLKRYPDRQFGLFIIDVNKLKQVNDEFGHYVGDELLKAVSELLIGACRQTDRVYRLGGDEFAILLDEGREQACRHLAARLEGVRGHTFTQIETGELLPIHFALGWLSSESMSPEKMFQEADKAMYEDKQAYRSSDQL